MTTTYLVTGATRGIGAAIVEHLHGLGGAVRIIAGVRDVQHANACALSAKAGVIVVEIDAERDATPFQAAEELRTRYGITTIDVVIANAGISGEGKALEAASADDVRRVFNVNVVGTLLVFQAFAPLLRGAARPVLLVAAALLAQFEDQDRLFAAYDPDGHMSVYAITRAATHFMTKRIALEQPWLTAVPFHPGVVATDDIHADSFGGKDGLQQAIRDGHVLTPQQSAALIVELAQNARQQTHSGRLFDVQAGVVVNF